MFIIVFVLLQCFGEGERQNHCTSIAVKNITNSIPLYWTSHAIQEINGNSDVGTCTNPHMRIDHVDHQHYPMVATHGVLANHVKVKDTFSLSQSEPLIKGFEQLAGEQEIYLLKNTTLNYTTLSCSLEENEHDKKYKITGNSQNNCVGTCTKVQLRFGHVKQYYHMFATQGRFLKLRPIKKLNFTFLMAHASEILIKRFMILEHYTQLAAKTFGFPSPLSNETKQWKIQTSFECQYVQRGYFVGIMVLPIGILLLLIEVTCSCGKFILQLIQGQREGHFIQLRKTTSLNKPHLNKSSRHQKISDNFCQLPCDLSSNNKYHGESPVSISLSEVKREHRDVLLKFDDKLVTHSNDNKSTMHYNEKNENINSESVNLLIPLHESVEQNEASKHSFHSLSPAVPEGKKEHEYPILTTFKTESMNTVSMMHAERVYIPPTTPSSCQLETILEIEEETDIPLYSPTLVETKHNVGSRSAIHSNSDQYCQFTPIYKIAENYSKEPLLDTPNSTSILPSHSSLRSTGFKFSHVPLSISYLPSSCYLPRKLSPLLYSTAIGLNGKISSTLYTTSKTCYNAKAVFQTPVSGSTSSYLSQTSCRKTKSKLPSHLTAPSQKLNVSQKLCAKTEITASDLLPCSIFHNRPTICPQRPTIRSKRSMKKCLHWPLRTKFFGSIKSFFTKTSSSKNSSAPFKQPNDFVIDIDTLKREFTGQGLECDVTPHSKRYLSWPCLSLPRSDRDYHNPHMFTSMSPKDHKRRDVKPAIQIKFKSNTIGTWV